MLHPPQEGSDRIFDIWHTSGCLMVDVPCLDHLWDGQKDCLDIGQVRCFHEETSRKLLFWKGDTKRVTEFQPKRACLTPTLMDEGQARNPNTTYNEYKMEFWKFA